jgi:hypothetical protein
MSLPTEALVRELRTTHDSLLRVLALLTPEEIESAALESGETPKAVLAQVAAWDRVQTWLLEAVLAGASALPGAAQPGQPLDKGTSFDASHPLESLLAEAEAARAALIRCAAALAPDQWATPYFADNRTLTAEQIIAGCVASTRRYTDEMWRYCGSMRRWRPESLRAFLVRQDANLMDSLGGLTEETLTAPGAIDGWSLRDGLVHILAWREYGYRVVKQWPQVDRAALTLWLEGDDVDAINAGLLAARAALNMIDIADGLTTYHRRLLTLLDQAGAAHLATYGDPGWGEASELSAFVYGLTLHEMEHAEEIWRWRVGRVEGLGD